MDQGRDLILAGLDEARTAVTDVIAMANLHLGPKKITRRMAQRASGRLKLIETIVRRLIMLLALSLTLAPARARGQRREDESTLPDWLPEGTVIAEFPRNYPRRLKLLPRALVFETSVPFPCSVRAKGPASPVRLIARIAAIQRVLATPEAHARRLARTIDRLRKASEPRPMIGPAPSAYRLRPELGALSTLLPELLNQALESWDTSP